MPHANSCKERRKMGVLSRKKLKNEFRFKQESAMMKNDYMD